MRALGSLLLATAALGGCGRLGFDGSSDGVDDLGGTNMTVGVFDATTRAPAISEHVSGLGVPETSDVDLAVATTPSGATVVWAKLSGGSLTGVDISTARTSSGPTVIAAGTFTASSAAFADGQLIAAGVNTSRTLVHAVPQPLGMGTEIGNFDGMYVGKTALAHSGGDRVTATSCSSGLTMNAFDTAWNGSEGTLSVSTNATSNIDMTPLGTQAFAVWSTSTSCHYERITSKTTGTTRQTMSKACAAGRLASDGTTVALVFQEGIRTGLVIDDAATVSVNNAVYATDMRSPRVLWDGHLYWVSFLTNTNQVAIGYVDAEGMLLVSRLPDPAPKDQAYELGMFDGQPWLFAVDPTDRTLSASRLCIPAT